MFSGPNCTWTANSKFIWIYNKKFSIGEFQCNSSIRHLESSKQLWRLLESFQGQVFLKFPQAGYSPPDFHIIKLGFFIISRSLLFLFSLFLKFYFSFILGLKYYWAWVCGLYIGVLGYGLAIKGGSLQYISCGPSRANGEWWRVVKVPGHDGVSQDFLSVPGSHVFHSILNM